MSEEASLDQEYLEMSVSLENKVETKDLPDSELRNFTGWKESLSVVEMAGGHRLILKNGEILVPKSLKDKETLRNKQLAYDLQFW